jgi:neutral ceramidase
MRAGHGKADITPPDGAILNGFIARLDPAQGVDLPLMARVVWLEEGSARALLVSLDLLGLAPTTADELVTQLAVDLDLHADGVILATTHTHSGPMTAPLRGLGCEDPAYMERLRQQVLVAARAAASSATEATLAWGTAPVAIGVNRRQELAGEDAVLGVNTDRPADTEVRVARLQTATQSILIFEHAAHPYCVGGDVSVVSPDFFGHAGKCLEQAGYEVLYMNGCAGDIAPLRGFGGPEAAREVGEELATAVLSAAEVAHPEVEPSLCVASKEVVLPHDELPDLAILEGELERADRTVRDEERADPRIRQRLMEAWQGWMSDLREALAGEGLPPLRARVSVLRLGSGALIALPGEVFYQTGVDIGQQLIAEPVCAAAYCHGYVGYVPRPEDFASGGYEVEEAHRFVSLWRVGPGATEMLQRTAVDLWKEIGGNLR